LGIAGARALDGAHTRRLVNWKYHAEQGTSSTTVDMV